jgi:hypothetical protein
MGIRKTLIGCTLTGALVAAQVGQAAAAPMPTSAGTMKAMVADCTGMAVGSVGGWARALLAPSSAEPSRAAPTAVTMAARITGIRGRTTGMLPLITVTARTTATAHTIVPATAIAPTARITATAMAIIGLTAFITTTTTGDIGDIASGSESSQATYGRLLSCV